MSIIRKNCRYICYIICALHIFCSLTFVDPIKACAASATRNVTFNANQGFDQKSYCVDLGEGIKLEKDNSAKVIYKIKNTEIASLASDGTIMGLKQGRTYLYANVSGKNYKCVIAVIIPRLSIKKNNIMIEEQRNLSVTLKNRKENEKVKVSVDQADILDAVVSGYKGDVATITVTPKKNGKATLVIGRTNSLEQLKVTVTVQKGDLSAVEIYKKCSKAMVEITSTNGSGESTIGSGFFVSKNKIITNYHVIEGATKMKVVDYAGKELNVVTVYDYNEEVDLALLGIDTDHDFMEVSYESNTIGERIYTIGSPYGLTGTFSTGIISMTSRETEEDDILYTQFTAPISRGNSGGPLIDSKGRAIGVNTHTRLEGQNLNFAVPSTYFYVLDESKAVDIQTFLKK